MAALMLFSSSQSMTGAMTIQENLARVRHLKHHLTPIAVRDASSMGGPVKTWTWTSSAIGVLSVWAVICMTLVDQMHLAVRAASKRYTLGASENPLPLNAHHRGLHADR